MKIQTWYNNFTRFSKILFLTSIDFLLKSMWCIFAGGMAIMSIGLIGWMILTAIINYPIITICSVVGIYIVIKSIRKYIESAIDEVTNFDDYTEWSTDDED